eukprot:TRINITY_DN3596_c0_g1_i1.p1 TRINITY_DN3596_c0_g1~~TRINITY_DN3596_c0_g1_i1.p1  ORF type:complete len:1369 (-),score=272.45 TRINITY_DN3596_c0_g1_i1:81-4187(-)
MFMSSFVKRFCSQYQDNDANSGLIWYKDIYDNSNPVLLFNISQWFPTCSGSIHQPNFENGKCDNTCDDTAWSKVGTCGLGGLTFNRNNTLLYVMNLFTRSIIMLKFENHTSLTIISNTTTQIPIKGHPGCSNSIVRPFALKHHDNKIYFGSVCSGELVNDVALLRGYVFEAPEDLSSFKLVLEIPLNYVRTQAGVLNTTNPLCIQSNYSIVNNAFKNSADWRPWTPVVTENSLSEENNQCFYPQPILSDIVFGDQGQMIIGIMDRYGHQSMNNNGQTKYSGAHDGIPVGDTLCAFPLGDGTWQVESGGVCGGFTGGYTFLNISRIGDPSFQGIAGFNGEFFSDDYYSEFFTEVSHGSLAIVPGSSEVISTTYDPYPIYLPHYYYNNTGDADYRAGGIRKWSTNDGRVKKSYVVYPLDQNFTFGESTGLGDIELSCDLAPVSVGDRVWHDANFNGIQDFNENGIENVEVRLLRLDRSVISSVKTSIGGYYSFSSRTLGIVPGAQYVISVNRSSVYIRGYPSNRRVFALSPPYQGNHLIDSDTTGFDYTFAEVLFTMGESALAYGTYDNSIDFGFSDTSEIGGVIWCDSNLNGARELNEPGIYNVDLELYVLSSNVSFASTKTDSSGFYVFKDLDPLVEYEVHVLLTGRLRGIASNKISPTTLFGTFNTSYFTLLTPSGVDTVYHLVYGGVQLGSVSGTIWIDDGSSVGVLDKDDTTVSGVQIELFDTDLGVVVSSTQSSKDGTYSISCVSQNTSYSVRIPTNQSQLAGYLPLPESTMSHGHFLNDSYIVEEFKFSGLGAILDFGFFLSNSTTFNGTVTASTTGLSETVRLNMTFDQTPAYNMVIQTQTDVNGSYRFDHIPSNANVTITVVTLANVVPSHYERMSPLVSEFNLNFCVGHGFIDGYVWNDVDRDNLFSTNDVPLENIVVELIDALLISTVTDSTGYYSFCVDGNFSVRVQYLNGSPNSDTLSSFGPTLNGNDPMSSKGSISYYYGPPVVLTPSISLMPSGNVIKGINIGFRSLSSYNGTVYCDDDDMVPYIKTWSNVSVILKDVLHNNNTVSPIYTVTDSNGVYLFSNVNINGTSGMITLDSITVTPIVVDSRSKYNRWNLKNSIAGHLWDDKNLNGQLDTSELRFSGVSVSLVDNNQVVVDTTITDVDASYSFLCVQPGIYSVVVLATTNELKASTVSNNTRLHLNSAGGSLIFYSNVTLGFTLDFVSVDFTLLVQNVSSPVYIIVNYTSNNNNNNIPNFNSVKSQIASILEISTSEITYTTSATPNSIYTHSVIFTIQRILSSSSAVSTTSISNQSPSNIYDLINNNKNTLDAIFQTYLGNHETRFLSDTSIISEGTVHEGKFTVLSIFILLLLLPILE